MDGWAFDVELLFLASKFGYRVVEVPINWYYEERSKINPVRDSIRMFREAIEVRLNDWRGYYRLPALNG
jgi:dolichyl-phosphate beta-glucosyltransferase